LAFWLREEKRVGGALGARQSAEAPGRNLEARANTCAKGHT